MSELAIDEYGFGLSWVVKEPMARASHALRDDGGGVWLIDPVDEPEAVERAQALGTPAGVIQLLDRHERDGAGLAERFGVPLHRLPAEGIPGCPLEPFKVVDVPRWREKGLWWEAKRALVVAEVVGTVGYFRGPAKLAGIHPFVRLVPPGAPRRYEPEHLLTGHGMPLHGEDAARGLEEAYRRSRRDIPAVIVKLPLSFRG